jgi:hypothetical protein
VWACGRRCVFLTFPRHVSLSPPRPRIQALRNLYALAVDARCLDAMLISPPPAAAAPRHRAMLATTAAAAPVPVAAEVMVTLKPVVLLPARGSPEGAKPRVFRARTLRLVTPCLLPELHTIESISVTGASPPAGAKASLEKATYSVGSVGAHAAVLLARAPPAMQAPADDHAAPQHDAAWNEKRADSADHASHAAVAAAAAAANATDTAALFTAPEYAAAMSPQRLDATMASRPSDAHEHRFSSAKRARLNGSATPHHATFTAAPRGDVEASLLASGFGPQTAAAAVIDTPFSSMNSSLNASLDFGEPTAGVFAGAASMLGASLNDAAAAAVDANTGSTCEADVVYHMSPSAAHALAHGVETKIPLVIFVQRTT